MTSKTLRRTQSNMNPALSKMSVGFDRLFDDFFQNTGIAGNGYPPFNITRINDSDADQYEITLAIAGFSEDDISIVLENNQLKVSGDLDTGTSEVVDYLHKGIAERNFTRNFMLAEHVEVKSATMRDGILRIRLVDVVPEELQAKRIPINA